MFSVSNMTPFFNLKRIGVYSLMILLFFFKSPVVLILNVKDSAYGNRFHEQVELR